jgi:hypothetical protein
MALLFQVRQNSFKDLKSQECHGEIWDFRRQVGGITKDEKQMIGQDNIYVDDVYNHVHACLFEA